MKHKIEQQYKIIHGFKIAYSEGIFIPLQDLASLYLLLKAVDGDILAREILDGFEKSAIDADNKQICPVKK